MTTMQALGGGAGLVYLVAVFWFLFLERKAGFTVWRVLATVLAPLTVPLLALVGLALVVADKVFSSQPKTEHKKPNQA
jgi:hypothetical protein